MRKWGRGLTDSWCPSVLSDRPSILRQIRNVSRMEPTQTEAACICDVDCLSLNTLKTSLEADLACLAIPEVILALDRSIILEARPILHELEKIDYDCGVLLSTAQFS